MFVKTKSMWSSCIDLTGLVVVDPEVGLVQDIYRRYLSCDSTADLISHLQKHNARNKTWLTRDGKKRGGLLLDRTAVYRILNNRMYIGEALFHGEWHSGIYPPIIDLDLWKQVQAKLAQRARRKGVPNETRNPLEFPLIGKLFWHDGRAYKFFKSSPRDQKQYLYYVAPATAEEKASGTGPVNLTTTVLQSVIIEHLVFIPPCGHDLIFQISCLCSLSLPPTNFNLQTTPA